LRQPELLREPYQRGTSYFSSEYSRYNFTAHTRSTGTTISHNAFGGGYDSHAQTCFNFRQLCGATVLTQTRATYALDAFTNRLAFVVCQVDGHGLFNITSDGETANVAFSFEQLSYRLLNF